MANWAKSSSAKFFDTAAAKWMPPIFSVREPCEGSGRPPGWNSYASDETTGSANWDYSTSPAPLADGQSLRITSDGFRLEYISVGNLSSCYAYFMFCATAAADYKYHNLFELYDPSQTFLFNLFANMETGYLCVEDVSEGYKSSSYALALNTVYHVWVEYHPSGAINVWISTTSTKPASPAITYTTSASSSIGYIGFVAREGAANIFDNILASRTCIDSNPWNISGMSDAYVSMAWRILTLSSRDTAWKVFGLSDKSAAWKLFGVLDKDLSWKIQSSIDKTTAWKILATADKGAAWKILATMVHDAAWKVFAQADKNAAWAILNYIYASVDASWKVFGDADVEASWKILATFDRDVAWKVLKLLDHDLAWKILNALNGDTAWKIICSIDREAAWQIFGLLNQNIAWKILTSSAQDSAWKIFETIDNATAGSSRALGYINGSLGAGLWFTTYRPASYQSTPMTMMPATLAVGDYVELYAAFSGGSFSTSSIYNNSSPFTQLIVTEDMGW